MQTLHLRAARYSLYVLFPCLALHFLNEHVIGGDTPCYTLIDREMSGKLQCALT